MQVINLSGFCLIVILSLTGISTEFAPFQDGPYETIHRTFYPFITSGLYHMVDVWVPDSAVETPIVYFAGAFGALFPGECYKNLFAKVASHGITIIQPSMLGNNPINNYEGIWLDDIMEWVETHLRKELSDAGVEDGLVLDHSSIFMMGHSAGSHIAVEYLKHHCGNAKGSILMSPVDGFDPYGIVPIYAISPGEYLNYAIPTLVLTAGLDNVKGMDAGAIVPACAPNDLSNKRFYDAFPGDSWLVNATYYGHADNLDDYYADVVHFTHFCGVADETHDREDYRRFLSGEIVTFIKYIMGEEDCSVLKYLQDPSLMPIETTVMFKTSSINQQQDLCKQSECKWQDNPYTHNTN